ncbi:MAG TPA: hypothetical protein VIM79_15535 [Niastella sp.]
MQRIDKKVDKIVSAKYKAWVEKLEAEAKEHPHSYRYYYDDVAMNLYKCQKGVCAYTEMFICVPELYVEKNWVNGRHKIQSDSAFKRNDHFGELEHFDPLLKKDKYWLWSNLFMIHSSVNSIKRDNPVVQYLKPDLDDYSPEKYFDYDEITHRFIPGVDIENEQIRNEIQIMIDQVLCLNHGVVQKERRDFVNLIKQRIQNNQPYVVDRFFTAVAFCLPLAIRN